MDPVSIAPLVLSAWSLLVPYAKKIAGKLVEKAGESLPDVVGKVWDTVKGKMEESPDTQALPADLVAAPDDQDMQGAFKYQLKKLLENDEAFAQQLEKLVNEAQQEITYSAALKGNGAIAQGPGAKAVGARGVLIEGNVDGSTIISGNNNRLAGNSTTDAPTPTKKGR